MEMPGWRSRQVEEKIISKKINIQNDEVELYARMIEKLDDAYLVEFSWLPAHFNFAEIIEQAGATPLPPILKENQEKLTRKDTRLFMHNMMDPLPRQRPAFILHPLFFLLFP